MTTAELRQRALELVERKVGRMCGCASASRPVTKQVGSLAITTCESCGGLAAPKEA